MLGFGESSRFSFHWLPPHLTYFWTSDAIYGVPLPFWHRFETGELQVSWGDPFRCNRLNTVPLLHKIMACCSFPHSEPSSKLSRSPSALSISVLFYPHTIASNFASVRIFRSSDGLKPLIGWPFDFRNFGFGSSVLLGSFQFISPPSVQIVATAIPVIWIHSILCDLVNHAPIPNVIQFASLKKARNGLYRHTQTAPDFVGHERFRFKWRM